MSSPPPSACPAAGAQDLLLNSPVPRRRLPPLPHRRTNSYSRPLPPIPRPLACKTCRTCITSSDVILSLSSIPQSRSFKGFSGKATLFTEIYNVKLGPPGVQLMATGAHTMQEISCSLCSTYLGWKIVRAHERSERWKEGHCLLELEGLAGGNEGNIPLALDSLSDSEEDSS